MEKYHTVIFVYTIEIGNPALSSVNIRLKETLQNVGNGVV